MAVIQSVYCLLIIREDFLERGSRDHNIVIQKVCRFIVSDFIVRWLTSFLCERQQRLKVFDALSVWVTLRGGMLPGSWLEPRIFVLLVNNLRPRLLTHKYLDDTTMTEIKVKDAASQSSMQLTISSSGLSSYE